jgi:hypothetical protein
MFSRTWLVVSSPDLDEDYLQGQPEGKPHVKLRQRGRSVQGEYQIGLLSGDIDGRLHGDQVLFSFAGMDEMEEVNGSGIASVAGDRLTLTLKYHMGDEFTFECEKAAR